MRNRSSSSTRAPAPRKAATAAGPLANVRVRSAATFPNASAQPGFFKTLRLLLDRSKISQPYAQHPWIYSAYRAQASALSQVPFRIYKEDKRTTPDARKRAKALRKIRGADEGQLATAALIESPRARFAEVQRIAPWLSPAELCEAVGNVEMVSDGEWVKVFTDVNPEMTRAQLWEATWLYLNTCGECFWVLEGALGPIKTPGEVPREIWPYAGEPDAFKPRIDKKHRKIVGWDWTYTYENHETTVPLEPFQVVRFRQFNPYNNRGLSSYEPARRDVETDWMAGLWNNAYFENGAQPGGYLIYEGDRELTEDEAEEILLKHEQRHRGSKKQHRTALLYGGIKFVPNQTNQRDMEFPAMRDRTRDVALACAETPRVAVGIIEDFNRANLDGTLRMWWETKLIPRLQYATDLCRSDLFTSDRVATGGDVWGSFDTSVVAALREDLGEKLAAGEQMFGMGVPFNDINARLGLSLPEYSWGNRGYVPIGLTPVDEAGGGDDDDDDDEEQDDKDKKDEPDDEEKAVAHAAAVRNASPERAAELRFWYGLLRNVFEPAEALFSRRLHRWLMDLRSEQLRLLKDQKEGEGKPVDAIFKAGPWTERLKKATLPAYTRTWDMAVAAMAEELEERKKTVRAKKPQGAVYIGKLQSRLNRVTRTIEKSLARVLQQAGDEGWTQEETLKSMRVAFNQLARGGRMGVVGRTEASATINGARVITMKDAGVEKHKWITAGDKVVRDTHRHYGRKKAIPIGANFAEGRGYTLRYPLDPEAPPGETINCRCVSVPV